MKSSLLKTVTFEQAVAIKKLGFPQEYISYKQKIYNIKGELTTQDTTNWSYSHEADAPTLEEVAKWFRVEKNYRIYVVEQEPKKNQENIVYTTDIIFDWPNTVLCEITTEFNDYDDALSAGIDKVINILTK